jgi:hypothetical protein
VACVLEAWWRLERGRQQRARDEDLALAANA